MSQVTFRLRFRPFNSSIERKLVITSFMVLWAFVSPNRGFEIQITAIRPSFSSTSSYLLLRISAPKTGPDTIFP